MSGRCHAAQSDPRIRLATRAFYRTSRRGRANPRQATSSPTPSVTNSTSKKRGRSARGSRRPVLAALRPTRTLRASRMVRPRRARRPLARGRPPRTTASPRTISAPAHQARPQLRNRCAPAGEGRQQRGRGGDPGPQLPHGAKRDAGRPRHPHRPGEAERRHEGSCQGAISYRPVHHLPPPARTLPGPAHATLHTLPLWVEGKVKWPGRYCSTFGIDQALGKVTRTSDNPPSRRVRRIALPRTPVKKG